MNAILSIATSGLNSAMRQMQAAATGIAASGHATAVDPMPIEQAMANALEAKTVAAANAAVIRRADDMIGRLLDEWA